MIFKLSVIVFLASVKSEDVSVSDWGGTQIDVVGFPNLPRPNIPVLRIKGKIPILYKDSVTDITHVSDLEFVENGLERIEPGAFKNFTRVRKLGLSHNKLTNVTRGVFDDLKLLELDLSFNQISTIQSGVFDKLTTIQILHLEHNKLQTFENGVFVNLPKLLYLHLSHNQITKLSEDFLDNVLTLQQLHLDNNRLTSFEEISQNSLLNVLNLASNLISTLPENFFQRFKRLREIILSHNNISTVEKNVFNNHQELTTVDLSDNQVAFIHPEAFDHMHYLQKVSLSNNKLRQYNARWFFNCSFIFQLDFSNNQIETLPNEAFKNFDGNPNLSLVFDDNKIELLSPLAFKKLRRIYLLSLKRNAIETWNDEFLADAEVAVFLHLENNRIVCPEGSFNQTFKALTSCLFGNPLSDACLEKIQKWQQKNDRSSVHTMEQCSQLIHRDY